MNCNVEEIIRKRKSVRTFEKRPLVESDKNAIIACLSELSKEVSPFPAEIRFQFLDIKDGVNTEKLGTYGVIKGAGSFLGVVVPQALLGLEAAGYAMEELVLYATHLGLGTCWVGFFPNAVTDEAFGLPDNEKSVFLMPLGYPSEKAEPAPRHFLRKGLDQLVVRL